MLLLMGLLSTTFAFQTPNHQFLELDGMDDYAMGTGISLDGEKDWSVYFEFIPDSISQVVQIVDMLNSTAGDGLHITIVNNRLKVSISGPLGLFEETLQDLLLEEGQFYQVALHYDYDSVAGSADMSWHINGTSYPSLSGVKYENNPGNEIWVGRADSPHLYYLEAKIANLLFFEDYLFSWDESSQPDPAVPAKYAFLFKEHESEGVFESSTQPLSLTASGGAHTMSIRTLYHDDGWVRFNGNSSYLRTENLNLGLTDSWTFEFDIRAEHRSENEILAYHWDPVLDTGFSITLQNGFITVFLGTNGRSSTQLSSITKIDLFDWTRIAVVYEYQDITKKGADNLKIYIDGELDASTSGFFDSPSDRPLFLGARPSGGGLMANHFRGDLNQVQLSTSARYLAASYDFFPFMPEPDAETLGYWPMDGSDPVPVTVLDQSGLGNDFTAFECEGAFVNAEPWSPDAAVFSGVNGQIYAAPMFFPDSDTYTLEFYLMITADMTEMTLFDCLQDGKGFRIFINSQRELSIEFAGTINNHTQVPLNQWRHIAITVFSDPNGDDDINSHQNGAPNIFGLHDEIGDLSEDSFFSVANGLDGQTPFIGTISTFRISDYQRYGVSVFDGPRFPYQMDSETIAYWDFSEGDPGTAPVYFDSAGSHDLVLCQPLSIVQQPEDIFACGGDNVLFVCAVDQPGVVYQWFRNGTEVAGATQSSLALSNVQNIVAGDYQCRIRNACDEVLTDEVSLNLTHPLMITTHPQSQTLCAGEELSLSIALSASKRGGITYQWQKDGLDLPGETFPSLSIPMASPGDAGVYRCLVDGQQPCDVQISQGAVIEISGPTLNAGQPVWICQPGDGTQLQAELDCGATGDLLWLGPGSISGETTLSPMVTPPSIPGIYLYELTFTPDFGPALSSTVPVFVADATFGFPDLNLADLFGMLPFWRDEHATYDLAPVPDGDMVVSIQDLVFLTNCQGFTAIVP